ncbi:drug resistance transporter, EmrB/QacA subfamily [Parafrankia irregularis]|uniref:Drug resistance transporter, EmrB/QacA subfamily n=1 Tax=Parafrankia irregularis TaxID=795642 RepID=A0A0S4QXW6_9ACTN|nr:MULTISPECIES: MFS transporter [Parafrankia]MBE3203583.1 MFS transporter [Parafrankia sp. CH37]CUU60481.1 drug resistance transporter, EmrB/QacA subfamily [Parafrankia irregularis]
MVEVELTRNRRFAVLGICSMSLLIVGLDNTIVNIALPSLRRDFDASPAGLQWSIDGYTIVLASLLMLAGSMGDRLGRRRIFQAGLALFTLGSLLCSIAPSLHWLVAFRMVQAVGGSMLNPVAMSIITNTFTDPRERARAIGVWGAVVGISMALGPVLGGVLVEWVGWRSIFWINIPIGLIALTLAQLYVPESRASRPRRLDAVGQVLVIFILATLTYSLIAAPEAGWTSARTLGLLAGAGVAVALLVRYESRREEPLLDVRLFRVASFSGATLTAVCALGALGGSLLLNTIYLQDVRGYQPLHAGLVTLPMAAGIIIGAPLSGRAVARFGPRPSLLAAGVGLTLGSLAMVGFDAGSSTGQLLIAYTVFGAGFGLVNAPITNTAVSGMPVEQAGVAAAVASTSRQVGQSLGVALVGSVAAVTVTAAAGGAGGGGESTTMIDAMSPAGRWVVVAASAATLVLGLTTAPRRRRVADAVASAAPAASAASAAPAVSVVSAVSMGAAVPPASPGVAKAGGDAVDGQQQAAAQAGIRVVAGGPGAGQQ